MIFNNSWYLCFGQLLIVQDLDASRKETIEKLNADILQLKELTAFHEVLT